MPAYIHLSVCLSTKTFGDWLTQLERLASSQSAGWATRLDLEKRWCCSSSPNGVCWQSLQGRFGFFLRPSTDCMRPTHIKENYLLYSRPLDLNVDFVWKNTFTVESGIIFDQISGSGGPARLTQLAITSPFPVAIPMASDWSLHLYPISSQPKIPRKQDKAHTKREIQ